MIALAFAVLGLGVALVLTGGSEPQRVASEPIRVGSEPSNTQRTWVVIRQDLMGKRVKTWPWSCGKGEEIPIPSPGDVLPAGVSPAVLGPIVQAADTMIEIVRQVFAALGWKRRCTVRGGEFAQLAIAQVTANPRAWVVEINGRYLGEQGQVRWRYEGTTDDTLALTLASEDVQADWSEGARQHMLDGRIAPPGQWWPHGNLQQWQAYGDATYVRRPIATVYRSGESLVLSVWLPPRAPVSSIDALGRRTIKRSVAWMIDWSVT